MVQGRLHGLTGSTVGHRTIASAFKPWLCYVRRVFHFSLRLITFGDRLARIAYLVHKSGCKIATLTWFTDHQPNSYPPTGTQYTINTDPVEFHRLLFHLSYTYLLI